MHSFQIPENDPVVAARGAANSWLSQFAPLLKDDEFTSSEECDGALATLKSLRVTGPRALAEINRLGQLSDQSLISTLQQAIRQLDSVEDSVRKRLALVQPGDPDGVVDLVQLQSQLALRAARDEMNVPRDEGGAILELNLARPNPVAAAGLGLFALAWNSFTLVHMVFMIGGMWHTFGPVALFLLLFYSVFIGAGLAMIIGLLDALSTHTAELNGLNLIVRKRIGGWTRTKAYEIKPSTTAYFGIANVSSDDDSEFRYRGQRLSSVKEAITLTDVKDRAVTLATPQNPAEKDRMLKRINMYLASQNNSV